MVFCMARVAPEKADFRPALPMLSLVGGNGFQVATKRKSLSKKTRFEVFKRDSFKCQYCGAASPEAVLVVDHIHPVSKDGEDSMMNYITACQPCNAGKSDRTLDDNTAIQKQRAQLEELNERREQLEMMMQWRDGLKEISEMQVEQALSAWKAVAVGWGLNEKGVKTLRDYIKKYGLDSVLDGIDVASEKYIKVDEETGDATPDSVDLGWSKLGGILAMKNQPESQRQLHYIKGILRNRLSYVPADVMSHLQSAFDAGCSLDAMKAEAKEARSWTQFRVWLDT